MSMKKSYFAICLILGFFGSCIKKHTCECKDSKGQVVQTSWASGGYSDMKKFKENCEKTKFRETNVNGVVTETPCEIK